jgi:hypothetical protein
MSEVKPWYKSVVVTSGPAWCQGKTGFLDEATGQVFFDPQEEPPTRETVFRNAYPESLLVLETVRSKSERAPSTAKLKSDVSDAFST